MAQYHRDMAAWLEWQADIERWRDSIDSRVEGLEETVGHLLPELMERLGPRTISVEHQHTIQQGVKHLADLLNLKPGQVYADLNASFHVPRYAEIPEDRWQEVAEWFRMRVQAAERRRKS
jgi:hypothetical protein